MRKQAIKRKPPDTPPDKLSSKKRQVHLRRAAKIVGDSPAPFVLRFEGCDLCSPLAEIIERLSLYIELVRRAVKVENRAYGLRLRKSATIVFDYYPALHRDKVKVITGRRTISDVTESGDLTYDEVSGPEKPWRDTAKRAIQILKAMQRYLRWSITINDICARFEGGDQEALKELPDTYPKIYFVTYIKPLFGDEAKQVWRQLVAIRETQERREAITEITQVPEQSTSEIIRDVTSAIESEEKDVNTIDDTPNTEGGQ